jgi:isopenicillin N synthase-like dioxygenase
VAQQIGTACEEVGFFVVTNHGVDQHTIDKAWNDTQSYFDMPVENKVGGPGARLLMTNDFPYGYSPFGGEVLSKGKVDVDGEAADDVKGGKVPDALQSQCLACTVQDPRAPVNMLKLLLVMLLL